MSLLLWNVTGTGKVLEKIEARKMKLDNLQSKTANSGIVVTCEESRLLLLFIIGFRCRTSRWSNIWLPTHSLKNGHLRLFNPTIYPVFNKLMIINLNDKQLFVKIKFVLFLSSFDLT